MALMAMCNPEINTILCRQEELGEGFDPYNDYWNVDDYKRFDSERPNFFVMDTCFYREDRKR